MKPVRIVIASKKRLIVQSIGNSLAKDNGTIVWNAIIEVETLIESLHTATLDILIIDQQMLEELYIWKNIHPKTLNRTLKVLLVTSEKYNGVNNDLPGFFPNQISFLEKGMDELLICFKLLQKNKFLQLQPINLKRSLKKSMAQLN